MRGSAGLPTPAVATFVGLSMSTPTVTNGRGSDAPRPPAAGAAPPHSIEAEQSVLGAMLLSDRTHYAFVIEEALKAEDFYRERHREVYESMIALFTEGESIDVLTVTEHLRSRGRLDAAGGQAEIDALTAAVPAVGNLRQYAQIVRERALLRRLLAASYEIQASVHGHEAPPREIVERAERAVLEVAHDDRTKDFRKVGEVLGAEIRKWQELSAEGRSLTGTPSGFADLDAITGGFQPGNLIIIAARPAMGKCLGGSTLVYDPLTGARRRVDEVVRDVEGGEEGFVASLGPDFRLRVSRVSRAFRNGVRPLFCLKTKLGRRVVATANHPLLTVAGWRRLDELEPGDRIAVPRRLPRVGTGQTMPDHEIVMLAALIADGSIIDGTPTLSFGKDSPVVEEVQAAAEEFGVRLRIPEKGWGTGCISAGRGSGPNPVTELCRRHELWGKRSEAKFVPDTIFGLDDSRIARFLAVLYACDGHVYASDRLRQIGYTTISERLADDVQHLLLRLGIVAKIRTLRRPVYDGTGKMAREVLITGQDDLRAFCREVAVCGKTAKMAALVTGLMSAGADTNVDTVPPAVWHRVLAAKGERRWADISAATGRRRTHNWHVGTRGVSRSQLATLAAATGSDDLQALAVSDVWWDEVATIDEAGEEETFDLEVPGDHNFVANDVVVHNSALVTNMAENVALHKEQRRPVALFSLEMSEAELAQRFIASQASIKGDDLRKGRLRDEAKWKRVLRTAAEYDVAPLYVDDSSDVGILDIRAKARRLHQQAQADYGGLGLIIVDYLQLMRADARIESRVQQVGDMSRGLKILARELDVPVIALSQLSRGVESRTDKRPMLSDLRESGNLEQDADLVIFIYRDEYYFPETTDKPGEAELIIAKHRNGGLGDVPLTFQNEYPRFLGLQRAA
jgi:replicative DNA helicase